MKKGVLLLPILFFAIVSLAFSQDFYTIISDGLNVRKGPGTDYDSMGLLYRDDIIEVLEINGEWAKINFTGNFGYVNKNFIQQQAPERTIGQISPEITEDKNYTKPIVLSFIGLATVFLIILHNSKAKISWYRNENSRLHRYFDQIKKQSEQDNVNLKRNNIELEKKIELLEKCQDIIDAKEEAKKIRENIKTKLSEVEKTLNAAIKFYHETMEQARRRAEDILKNTEEELPLAIKILKTAESMQNVIEGYGNQYLVPGYSVFDELAYEYSFDESGQQLKLAREKTRMMIKQGKAADCEYIEKNRREMAIGFVIDAFNGKIDTILASAKTDNAEILIQKMKDAYWTVNHLGSSFKNAHIQEDYLDSRIDELKWLIRVNELTQRRKDEQRELKEEERDAARAKREAEKELLKAQKEIIQLDAARNEIMLQFKAANEEEREKLEKRLRELEEQLKEKQIISTRAKSMAELGTTVGTVYIISNRGSFGDDVFKIGLTRRWDPKERVDELFSAGLPFPFDIHAKIPSDNAPLLERELHNRFAFQKTNKVNSFKEFFNVSCLDIKEAVESLGISADWTIEAKAQQYDESLKIARQLEDGSLSKHEYLKKYFRLTEEAIKDVLKWKTGKKDE